MIDSVRERHLHREASRKLSLHFDLPAMHISRLRYPESGKDGYHRHPYDCLGYEPPWACANRREGSARQETRLTDTPPEPENRVRRYSRAVFEFAFFSQKPLGLECINIGKAVLIPAYCPIHEW